MGPPLYMRSVVDRNVFMQRIPEQEKYNVKAPCGAQSGA